MEELLDIDESFSEKTVIRDAREDSKLETLADGNGECLSAQTFNRNGRDKSMLDSVIVGNVGKESSKEMESLDGVIKIPTVTDIEGEEENESGIASAGDDEVVTPKTGMTFNSFDEVREFYKKYASKLGFGIITRSTKCDDDGNMKYYTIACARAGKTVRSGKSVLLPRPTIKTDCKARINVRAGHDGKLYLSGFCCEHNHELTPGSPRYTTWNRKLVSRPKRKVADDQVETEPSNSQLLVEAGTTENVISVRKENSSCFAGSGSLRLGEGGAESLFNYFVRMQKQDSKFFYMTNITEECDIRNVFWADARSQASYELFGDVIVFETTYLTNGYHLPLASFVGVNHHGQFTLLGCALLFREDTESYKWLFKSFLACMSGCPPKAIVTEQSAAIQAAVSEVFPEAKRRLCHWHIMKKVPKKLGGLPQYLIIKKTLKDLVYESTTREEFEKGWKKLMKEFSLENNEWLRTLYLDREHWVPVFIKETFWAGLSTAQRSEKVNAIFDGYVQPKTTLKQFIGQYDNILRGKIEKEEHADFASSSLVIPTITDFPIEKHFQEAYTNEMFKLFQEELRGLIYCNASFVRAEGSVSTFQVKDFVKNKDGSRRKVVYDVLFNDVERDAHCTCHLFDFRGILCRHAVAVLFDRDVKEVPSRYVLTRWRKDIKNKNTGVKCGFEVLGTEQQMTRLAELRTRCHHTAEIAAKSEENFDFLKKVLEEVEEMMLKNESGSNRTDQVPFISLPKDGDKLNQSSKRRRGRPPTKNKAYTPVSLENDASPIAIPPNDPKRPGLDNDGGRQKSIVPMIHLDHIAMGDQSDNRIPIVQNTMGYAYRIDTSTCNGSFSGSYGALPKF